MGDDKTYKVIDTIPDYVKGLHLSSQLNMSDFYVHNFRDMDYLGYDYVQYHRLNFFVLGLSIKDNSIANINNNRYEGLNRTFYAISPHQEFNFHAAPGETDIDVYEVLFTAEFLGERSSHFDIQQAFPFFKRNTRAIFSLDESEFTVILNLFSELHKEANGGEMREILRGYLIVLLNQFLRITKMKQDYVCLNRFEKVSSRFEELLMNNSSRGGTISSFAESLNVSTIYLRECVKEATGKTAKQLMSEYQMLHIKSLLINSRRTLADIGTENGFSDTTNFIRFFKKQEGITPNQYRKNLKIDY